MAIRIFNASNMPNKRHRGIRQQRYEGVYPGRYVQNKPGKFSYNYPVTRNMMDVNDNRKLPSKAACRYATSCFPCSLFLVIFSHEVREKIVVNDLIKHTLNNC
jgi:hypothetical protein